MKVFYRIIICIAAVVLLTELNSGTLFDDIKGFFNTKAQLKEVPDSIRNSNDVPKEYTELLKNVKDIELQNTLKSKYRNPISFFTYKQQYYLQLYKVGSFKGTSLLTVIKKDSVGVKQSLNEVYTINENAAIDYDYKATAPVFSNGLLLGIAGKDNRTIVQNDSLIDYYSMFEKLSIKYKSDLKNDIYLETKGNGLFSHSLLPIEVMFIKKKDKLYFLTMSVLKEADRTQYKPGILYDIFTTINKAK